MLEKVSQLAERAATTVSRREFLGGIGSGMHSSIFAWPIALLLLASSAGRVATAGLIQLKSQAEAGAQYSSDILGPFISDGPSFAEESAFAFPVPQPAPLSDFAFAHAAASLVDRSVHSLSRTQGQLRGIPLRAYALGRTAGLFVVTSPRAFPDPVDLDLQLRFDGTLDVGILFAPTPGQLVASVDARISLVHISQIQNSIRELTPFVAAAALDGTFTQPTDAPPPATLSASGGWSLSDFVPAVSSYHGTAFSLDMNSSVEDVLSVTLGDLIYVEIALQTSAFAVGAFGTGARADFFNSGSFQISSSTPDVVFQPVREATTVPEPHSLVLLGLGVAVLCGSCAGRIGRFTGAVPGR